jgi:hypothetical protein
MIRYDNLTQKIKKKLKDKKTQKKNKTIHEKAPSADANENINTSLHHPPPKSKVFLHGSQAVNDNNNKLGGAPPNDTPDDTTAAGAAEARAAAMAAAEAGRAAVAEVSAAAEKHAREEAEAAAKAEEERRKAEAEAWVEMRADGRMGGPREAPHSHKAEMLKIIRDRMKTAYDYSHLIPKSRNETTRDDETRLWDDALLHEHILKLEDDVKDLKRSVKFYSDSAAERAVELKGLQYKFKADSRLSKLINKETVKEFEKIVDNAQNLEGLNSSLSKFFNRNQEEGKDKIEIIVNESGIQYNFKDMTVQNALRDASVDEEEVDDGAGVGLRSSGAAYIEPSPRWAGLSDAEAEARIAQYGR